MDGLGTTTHPDAAPRFERAPMHQGASTDQLLRAADGLDAIAATCAGARRRSCAGWPMTCASGPARAAAPSCAAPTSWISPG